MNNYKDILKTGGIILLDGGMGTLIQKYNLKLDDFDGYEGLNEMLNITHPEIIEEIHLEYLNAGAMALETNSFGGSIIKLAEYGLEKQVYELNYKAAVIAKDAIKSYQQKTKSERPLFVIGSMGPTGKLPSSTDPVLGDINFDQLEEVFYQQSKALIDGGVDVLLLETQHDILEVKAGIFGCKKAISESCRGDISLQVQVTVDESSKMLFGTDISTALNIVKDLGIDVFGMNCSTGPGEMEKSIKLLSEYSPLFISTIPNAGMPFNENGEAVYKLGPDIFAQNIKKFINKYGIQVVGGCCGTSPAHIKAVAELIADINKVTRNEIKPLEAFASPIANFESSKAPIIIGERINSQGSRKAKELILNDNYSNLVDLAKDQKEQGADLLDVCFAMTERNDEADQICKFTKKVAYTTKCPICFDSTEADVLLAAVKQYAGRPLINSINLESDKLLSVLPIIKQFSLSTIALCIDKNGMAKTIEEKVSIAKQIYDIAVLDFKLKPEQLIFDPLTFTLATGEDEYKQSATNTFSAIKQIKKELPGVRTVLGVSNVSFGLSPKARRVLNLVYLHIAVEHGLDMAIFNAAHYSDISTLSDNELDLAKALLFNSHKNALTDYINYFQQLDEKNSTIKKVEEKIDLSSIEDIIANQVINRKQSNLHQNLEKAREKYAAVEIINTILLPAMKTVGAKMETGEIILPFVLESAEIMKKAITYLEKYLDQSVSIHKGTVVLATVYGDVHDIGKNLVKTITANNGYNVIDLGKQVPAELIIKTAIEEKADAITLSALLVTTSKQMQLIVEELHKQKLNIPVIIGGAAINDAFASNISTIDGTTYAGGVYYSKDAFSGLKILDSLLNG